LKIFSLFKTQISKRIWFNKQILLRPFRCWWMALQKRRIDRKLWTERRNGAACWI